MYILNIMTGNRTRMNETLSNFLAPKLTTFAKSLRSLDL